MIKKLNHSIILGIFLAQTSIAAEEVATERGFAGLKFGVGLSLTHDLGENNRVGSASLVNGIVRVDDENNDIARIMLESHYFFKQSKPFTLFNSNVKVPSEQWGRGPFVAIQPGTDEVIEAISLGMMWGFKKSPNPADKRSWNIGIGAVVDPNVKVLGDGISENVALPTGETGIRYKDKSQWGLMLLTSFSF